MTLHSIMSAPAAQQKEGYSQFRRVVTKLVAQMNGVELEKVVSEI